jgi:hypothetical protein
MGHGAWGFALMGGMAYIDPEPMSETEAFGASY